MTDEKVGAVIVAAGKGERMRGEDKLFTNIGGAPLLVRVIDLFNKYDEIDQIVVVLGADNVGRGKTLIEDYGWSKVSHVCQGGDRRQDSVRAGIRLLDGCEWVVIHDGARPMADSSLIERGLLEARSTGAAIAAVPVKDTIKESSPDGFVKSTPARGNLWAAQTPQVFRLELIRRAHEEVTRNVSDDSSMVEELGYPVKIYMGSYENIKITTPEDMALAEIILGAE
ncbi:MAG: 2-C-methyl-D-erythritol 4-phosphate cytidylyltransferase [Dehalococcoidia bacterium]